MANILVGACALDPFATSLAHSSAKNSDLLLTKHNLIEAAYLVLPTSLSLSLMFTVGHTNSNWYLLMSLGLVGGNTRVFGRRMAWYYGTGT
jgi:hypothetical protein